MPGQEPSFVNTSLRQIPHACTLMRTCPEVGLGISRSMIWKSAPGLETCATFIVATETVIVAIKPPLLAAEATNHLLTTPRNAPCDSDLNRQIKKSWKPRPSSRFAFSFSLGLFYRMTPIPRLFKSPKFLWCLGNSAHEAEPGATAKLLVSR